MCEMADLTPKYQSDASIPEITTFGDSDRIFAGQTSDPKKLKFFQFVTLINYVKDLFQPKNSRLSSIANQANPSTLKLFQLNPSGSITFVDPPTSGSGSVDWANPGTIGSGTANTARFTGFSLKHDATTDVALQTYKTTYDEYGLTTQLIRLSGGRFDFLPIDDKAEIRLTGANTQFNIYNLTNNYALLNINSDRTVDFYNTLRINGTSVVLSTDVRLTNARNPIAGSVSNASVASDAAIDWAKISKVGATSDNFSEGATNLFFTTARARSAFTAGSNISITNGVISATSPSVDWANPGTIGSGTPNTGKFTTLEATSGVKGFRPIVPVASAKTLGSADANTMQVCSGTSAYNVTIPADATFNFPIGTEIEIHQDGTGAITVAAETNCNVRRYNSTNTSHTLLGQYSAVSLKKVAVNEWRLYGL